MHAINKLNKLGTGSSSWTLKVIVVVLLGACSFAPSCKRTQTIWSDQAQSPDRKMIATARAVANGGFGVSGAPATFVYLDWAAGSQSPTKILSLDDQSDRADEVAVGMKWLASDHLELTYSGKHQNIGFQAVKFDGVDISVRDISNAMSSGNTR